MQLVDKYKPTTIEAFAGVDRPKKILSAFTAKPYTSAWLLIGPSGTGKTTMAFAAADALGCKQGLGGGIYHIPARACDLDTINSTVSECYYAPMSGSPWNVVLIDEADQMTNAAQLSLLSKLDSADPPPNTIWFFTANETSKLEERFLSRCRKIQFTTDGLLAPGCALLKKIWLKETRGKSGLIKPGTGILVGRPPEPDFEAILRTAGFNVREALMLLETEILCPGSVCETAPAQDVSTAKRITKVGKGNGAGTIYTIGAAGYTVEAMRETVKALGCHVLLDCYWKPQRMLRAGLGDAYKWAGDRISEGRMTASAREDGVKWLLGLVAPGKNVMLMFAKEEPGQCYRHKVIGRMLLDRGVDVTHVWNDELIQASDLQKALDLDEAEPKVDHEYKFKKWRLPKAVGE